MENSRNKFSQPQPKTFLITGNSRWPVTISRKKGERPISPSDSPPIAHQATASGPTDAISSARSDAFASSIERRSPARFTVTNFSLLLTIYYFMFFIVILPILGLRERPERVPDTIAKPVTAGAS